MRPEAAKLRRWIDDPVKFVVDELHVEKIDPWQFEFLKQFPNRQRLALKSCKGPGKTAVLAWCSLNFLATRPDAKIAATSITSDNLNDNLWPELSKWMERSEYLKAAFEWSKTRIVCRESPENWFMSARTWPRSANKEQQANTLAGLHADYAMFVLDEAGGIPDAVAAAAEGGLATGKETKILIAGNPTHLEGPLYRACTSEAHLWYVAQITGDPDSPKRSSRVSVQWAREQIEKYGRDNPWVLVNVFGEFPPSSLNVLLGPDEVNAALGRHLPPDVYEWAQKRMGIDVARFGDDRSVIFPRQGKASFMPLVMRHQLTTDIAARVARHKKEWGSEVEFVDDSGHWGHGVIDNLRAAGYKPIAILFEDRNTMDPRYANKRAEMWCEMAEWVKSGGALPPLPDLVRELTAPTYTFVQGKFMLEPKDQIKARIGNSPDLGDALALTFALPDRPAGFDKKRRDQPQSNQDYKLYPQDTKNYRIYEEVA
jgi:phage terminase large subunit